MDWKGFVHLVSDDSNPTVNVRGLTTTREKGAVAGSTWFSSLPAERLDGAAQASDRDEGENESDSREAVAKIAPPRLELGLS